MKTQLIALVVLAAGAVPGYDRQIDKGDTFEADSDVAEALQNSGQAALASQAASTKRERTVKARVLSACAHGNANDLIELSESVAKQAEKAGLIDTGKEAVAYAAALDQNKPKA